VGGCSGMMWCCGYWVVVVSFEWVYYGLVMVSISKQQQHQQNFVHTRTNFLLTLQ